VDLNSFPQANGQTLRQLADGLYGTGTKIGLATSVFTPGVNRLAFGVVNEDNSFVYAPTAVYVAPRPNAKARGPYAAPADLLVTDTAYRSQQAATEKDPFAAVYDAKVQLPRASKAALLVVTKTNGRLIGAGTMIKIVSKHADRIPDVGEKAPVVDTETVTSAGGDKASIDTRRPFDDMHDANFADVVGKKPVALLYATPQLCSSRVCGPVVDIAAQPKNAYGDEMTFIHQEVYRDNDANKGLREPLQRFNLTTEPWLFVVGADGRITARLEGSFGFEAFNRAVKTATTAS